MNQQQLAIIHSLAPKIAVNAGAGSGKTRVLVERIKRLVSEGVAPSSIVCITFTNVAANEMMKRLGNGMKLNYCGTVHGLMLRAIREHGAELGFPSRITVLSQDAATEYLKQAMSRYHTMLPLVQLEAEMAKGPGRFFNPSPTRRTQPEILAANIYGDMIASGVVTFDTILQFGLEIVQRMPDKFACQHLFWDEFQDTGDDDAAIFHALPMPNKFVVFDIRQAIYSFRGAEIKNCLRIASSEAFTKFNLQLNYRCAKGIVDAANRLMEHAKHGAKPMIAATEEAGSVEIFQEPDNRAEIDRILKIIHEETTRGIPYEEIAILCRSNAVREAITERIKAAQIPVAERKIRKPDASVMAFLSFLAAPDNRFAAEQWHKHHCKLARLDERKRLHEAASKHQTLTECFYSGVTDNLEIGGFSGGIAGVMALAGFGIEQCYGVHKRLESIPTDATVNDLIAAFHEPEPEESMGGLTISTIHGAKGKEWHTVILPAFEQEQIPGTTKARTIEEERRIAFVAITRAKRRLVIIHAEKRFSYGLNAATPSQFIAEAMVTAERKENASCAV